MELVSDLQRLGFAPVPSAVHFFLVPVPSAAVMAGRLADRHILVRDCTSFGLADHIRIATQKPDDNARLISALAELR
jgi:histidinol-phosphate/aromatic aminotransferase/cobyric acid decarboxylase-like protein